MHVAADEGFKALAVGELQERHAAARFHQLEMIDNGRGSATMWSRGRGRDSGCPLPPRMRPLTERSSNVFQLRGHAFADRLPVYGEIARLAVGPTNVGEAQKIKGLRLPFSALLPSGSGIASAFDQARFLRV